MLAAATPVAPSRIMSRRERFCEPAPARGAPPCFKGDAAPPSRTSAAVELRGGHWDGLGVHAGARGNPMAARLVGPPLARPPGQGAVAVGVAVLPAGEDRQGIPP